MADFPAEQHRSLGFEKTRFKGVGVRVYSFNSSPSRSSKVVPPLGRGLRPELHWVSFWFDIRFACFPVRRMM